MAQHYVSRFYFKPFACDSDKSLVFSMSRDYTIHDKPSQISNICSKKNYNTPEQERTQSSLESEYAEILRNLIATVQGKNNFYIVDEFILKCYRLFRPKFRKVKTSFFAQIPQVSNTLTPSEGVCDYTPV